MKVHILGDAGVGKTAIIELVTIIKTDVFKKLSRYVLNTRPIKTAINIACFFLNARPLYDLKIIKIDIKNAIIMPLNQ